jgi:SAM-dependent methyltransferase
LVVDVIMNPSHWDSIYQGGPQQEPQSVRFAQVLAGVKQQIAGIEGRLLLLGVSPSLSDIGSDVTAVDRKAAVVRHRWPGNTPNRRAVVADWLQLPFADGSFALCVGDGSMNAMEYRELKLLYDSLGRVMRRGGKVVCRMYLTPDVGETIAEVAKAPWQGKLRSFLYFKFRLGMAIAADCGEPSVRVKAIYDVFTANFPDRDRLAAATGWDRSEIDKIDLYRGSSEVYNFPTRRQCLSIVPADFSDARFVQVGNYELAERCPLLVMERKIDPA